MGTDFAALIHFDGDIKKYDPIIKRFESGEVPVVFQRVIETNHGQYHFSSYRDKPIWETFRVSEDLETDVRPQLPDTKWALYTSAGFFLLFGKDTIGFYHLLRWHIFLIEEPWHSPMCDATRYICQLFHATDCILLGDDKHAWGSFLSGDGYETILHKANTLDGGPVEHIGDMYYESQDADTDLAWKPVEKAPGEIFHQGVIWPHDKPLPDGWVRATIWDSRGYWRLPLADH